MSIAKFFLGRDASSYPIQGMLDNITASRSYVNSIVAGETAQIPLAAEDKVAFFFPTVGTNFYITTIPPVGFPVVTAVAGGAAMTEVILYHNPAVIDLRRWRTRAAGISIRATNAMELGVLIYQ